MDSKHNTTRRQSYASATFWGCQESEPMLSANASMPAEWARLISSTQSWTVYGYVFPTMKCATTYFGLPEEPDDALAAGAVDGVGVMELTVGVVVVNDEIESG